MMTGRSPTHSSGPIRFVLFHREKPSVPFFVLLFYLVKIQSSSSFVAARATRANLCSSLSHLKQHCIVFLHKIIVFFTSH